MTKLNNETLQAEKISFELLNKDYKGFTKKSMPAVLEALKQYKATGKYPYNNDVKNFILGLCKIKSCQRFTNANDEIKYMNNDIMKKRKYFFERASVKIGIVVLLVVAFYSLSVLLALI